ncbi:MAG: PIN/TRAM domain-containing protein [Bryobacteraceae bacterium]
MRSAARAIWGLRAIYFASIVGFSLLLRPFGSTLLCSLIGALLATGCVLIEQRLHRVRLATLVSAVAGFGACLCLGVLLARVFTSAFPPGPGPFLRLFLPLSTGFVGLAMAIGKSESLDLLLHRLLGNYSQTTGTPIRYLDTSALIDGRIADIADAGCAEGFFVIPQFVLNELQAIADSADAAKRNRGRRGLEVVARLQRTSGVRLEISPTDYADVREVDLKLVEAARSRNGQIVTTDFNLSKLAQAQGLRVFNLNQLATALRPLVLQGETMRVFIAKEGKEATQGVAYLEDGTMVVVENARRQIGKTIDIIVTGVVQNTTGKMIFGKCDDGKGSANPRGVASGFSRPL